MAASTEGPMQDRILYRLTWLAMALSLGHHLDHLIRGDAVGWSLTDEVNAFDGHCPGTSLGRGWSSR
jgi:hypothetical protein